jgi:hypothetical protein
MADREVEIVYEGVDTRVKLDQKAQTDLAARLQAALLRTYELRLQEGHHHRHRPRCTPAAPAGERMGARSCQGA